MAQLDGSDIVYVARVSVPKIIALRVDIGTRFPAAQTSQGKVLLAALCPTQLADVLAQPSRAGLPPYTAGPRNNCVDELTEVRARGWALADEELAPGRPLGRGPGARRHRHGAGRDERHRARGRDHSRARCCTTTSRCCCGRQEMSARSGRSGSLAHTSRSSSGTKRLLEWSYDCCSTRPSPGSTSPCRSTTWTPPATSTARCSASSRAAAPTPGSTGTCTATSSSPTSRRRAPSGSTTRSTATTCPCRTSA